MDENLFNRKGFPLCSGISKESKCQDKSHFFSLTECKRGFYVMYYPWNINGVKANVTEECLYINIGTYLHKKERTKIRKGEILNTTNTFYEKNHGTFVIYFILGYTEMIFYLEF